MRRERISAVACTSCNGLLDVRGTTYGDTFYTFVQTHLLPHLLSFDGKNPHSMVVMDNCSIHHVQQVVASIQDVGTLVHFLPPYSPDFTNVKLELKSKESQMQHNKADLNLLLLATFTTVTPEDCNG